jgi:plasmid stability protein
MSTLTVRNIDSDTKDRLRQTAAKHGRSMEEEVRVILRKALSQAETPGSGLGSRIHGRFAALGGVELTLQSRTDVPCAADFDEAGAV